MTDMRLVILGPPGAGKGTQAQYIKENHDIPHISTGDMLRKSVERETDYGKKAKQFMEKGELVPDEVVNGIVEERLLADGKEGFLLDGYPRNLEQAEVLESILDRGDRSLDGVLHIKIDDEEVIKRLTGRRVCDNCGENFHIAFNAPAESGICDKCKGELKQRKDDSREVVRERLKVYKENTEPLVEFYDKKSIIIDVSGNGTIEEVAERIESELRNI